MLLHQAGVPGRVERIRTMMQIQIQIRRPGLLHRPVEASVSHLIAVHGKLCLQFCMHTARAVARQHSDLYVCGCTAVFGGAASRANETTSLGRCMHAVLCRSSGRIANTALQYEHTTAMQLDAPRCPVNVRIERVHSHASLWRG